MLVTSEAQTPTAVFFDPTGRRRRVFRTALLVIICAAVALTALVVIGLRAAPDAPRAIVSPAAEPLSR
jgi:hypothetical protein